MDNLVLRSLNEVLREQAQEWAQEGKDPVSLTKLNIDNITANVHPRLWKMACIPTHPKHYTGKESLDINDRGPKTWHLACLYILGAMAHTMYAPCHYSFHLPITDYIEGQSGSADLL